MRNKEPETGMVISRKYVVLIVACFGFFLVSSETFSSLGYLLYVMKPELGWTNVAATLSYSFLGLACGLSCPLAPMLMKVIGTRMTMALGAVTLAAGCVLAAHITGIGWFLVATSLMGLGFSFVAPSPAVFLIATWFPKGSSAMLGYYFMSGAAGSIAGPLIAREVIVLTGDWRLSWMVMAGAAVVLAVLCLVGIRDAVKVETVDQVKDTGKQPDEGTLVATWSVRDALRTPAFIVLAIALTVVQTVVTTINAVLVIAVAGLGFGGGPGAVALGLLGFTAAITKGVTGNVCERVNPKGILVAGLALLSGAMAILWLGHSVVVVYAGAALFGVGWGLSWLAGNVLLVQYFGAAIAGEMIAMSTLAMTVAIAGPIAAGRIADVTGSYSLAMLGLAILLAFTTVLTLLLLRKPRRPDALRAGLEKDPGQAVLLPAE